MIPWVLASRGQRQSIESAAQPEAPPRSAQALAGSAQADDRRNSPADCRKFAAYNENQGR